MRLKEFGFRNLASYGNKLQKFVIADDPELILIIGENGAGKTTISDVITFANYGKLRKRKISGFANRANKAGEAYSIFTTEDNRLVETHRGLKPDFFKIAVDGVDKTIKDSRKIKAMLENELIGIPFDVFANTLLLSINDFESFADMDKANKRKIVDRIFGIDIFNIMKKELNDDRKEPQQSFINLDNDCVTKKTMLDKHILSISQIKTDTEQNKKNEADRIRIDLTNIQSEIDLVSPVVQSLKNSTSSQKIKLDAIQIELNNILKPNINNALLELSQLNNNKKLELSENERKLEQINISDVAKLTKQESEDYDDKSKLLNYEIEKINENTTKYYNDSLDKELVEITECDIKYEKLISDTNAKIEKIHKASEVTSNKLIKQISTIQTLRDNYYAESISFENDLNNIIKKIQLYKFGKCPECETDLTQGDHKHKATDYNKQHNKIKKSYDLSKTNFDNEVIKLKNTQILVEDHKNAIREIDKKESEIKRENFEAYNNEKSKIRSKITEAYQKQVKTNTELVQSHKAKLTTLKSEIRDKYQLKFDDIYSNFNIAKIKLNTHIDKKFKKKIEDITILLKTAEDTNKLKSNEYSRIYSLHYTELEELLSKENRLLVIQSDHKNKSEQLVLILQDKGTKVIINEMEKSAKALTKDYEETLDKCDDANEVLENYKIIDKLIGDTGLKRDFMRKFIPMLNQNIYDVHNQLNFKYSFYFDDDFNPVVTDDNEPIGLDTLSAGEKKEIDIMAVLAFIPLIKMRNPYTNVLFLDEIFYSLDKKNTALVTKLLKEFSIKYNMTIFVISHMDVPTEYFSKIYEPIFDGIYSNITQLK